MKFPSVFTNKLSLGIVSIALIVFSAYIFRNPHNQGFNWSFPYFSGAANFQRVFDWQISPSDYNAARKLSDNEYRKYKHRKMDNTIENTFNSYGYVLVALSAQKIFPFLGDMQGVILLQLLIHLFFSVFMIVKVFESFRQRLGFLFLYAANPLIVYFVTFPHYYFWMFLPSAAVLILWLRPDWRRLSIFWLTPLILFSILIRPTTLFLSGYFFVVAWFLAKSKRERWGVVLATTVFTVWFVLISGKQTGSPWHTMYVGIGAYKNSYNIKILSDNTGYEYFLSKTGLNVNTNLVEGNWNDNRFRLEYSAVLKARYIEILKDNPFLIIKNATLNTLQSFAFGYFVDRPWITLASAFFGLFVLVLFLYSRQFLWIGSILANSAGFAWYYPPIPAYNFASYMLIVVGLLYSVDFVISRKSRATVSEGN